MKASLGSSLFRFTIMAAVANCARAVEISPITPGEKDTYSITAKASNKFTRDTDKLKSQAMEAATKFCAKDGKQLKVLSVTEDKSMYLVGPYAQVTLTFKALSPGDLELAPPQGEVVATKPAVPASPATEQLYADITRLNELRKQGLLSDAEFEVEKKKILDRSK